MMADYEQQSDPAVDKYLVHTYCESWILALEKRSEHILDRQKWAEGGGRDTLAATYAEVRKMNRHLADYIRSMMPKVETLRPDRDQLAR
jgi:ribosomal protein L13